MKAATVSRESLLPAARASSPGTSSVERIWADIVHCAEQLQIAPGGQLPGVRELAERLSLRPTAIRDALLHAQARGAVRVVPRVGAFLQTSATAARTMTTGLDEAVPLAIQSALASRENNVLHLLDARRLIEVELVGRAAERRRLEDLLPLRRALEALLQLPADVERAEYVERDIRFHVAIARLSGNDVLAGIQATLMELSRPYLLEVPRSAERRKLTDQSHTTIYAALVDGDVERARREMQAHLSLAYDSMLGELRRLPTEASS